MATILDDSQLLRLASDPRTPLFTSLRGSSTFAPIVLLAGLLPGLAVVQSSQLTDVSGAWALRALDVVSAKEIGDWLEPGQHGLGSALMDQPPLGAWILALIARPFGTYHLTSWLIPSFVATAATVWTAYPLGRRLGGSAFGLITTLVVCSHPVTLRLATSTSPAALGVLLIALAIWGFLGHLEGPEQLVSGKMLLGSLAWGLALLAVGPVAVAVLVPMVIHVALLAGEKSRALPDGNQTSRIHQIWLGMRSLFVFILTAVSFTGWWQVMMVAEQGNSFWLSWWTGAAPLTVMEVPRSRLWETWLKDNVLIFGWLLVGLIQALREWRQPTSELLRRRTQFVLCWWFCAVIAQCLLATLSLRTSVLMDAWDALLLLPSALLTAWGVRSLVLRRSRPLTETLLPTITLGLCVWRWTDRPLYGVAGFIGGLSLLAMLPLIISQIRRTPERMKERDWSRLLRMTIVVQLAMQLIFGLIEFPHAMAESNSLVDLRSRISTIPPVPKVTLLTQETPPESLLFVLRSFWTDSQFVMAADREVGAINEPLATNPAVPLTDEIVIEWTRRTFRLGTEFMPNRQLTPVGDPLRFRGRRLMIYRINPKERPAHFAVRSGGN